MFSPIDSNDSKLRKHLKKGFAEIPAGSMNFEGKRYSFESFFIYKTELSNLEYKEYLAWKGELNKSKVNQISSSKEQDLQASYINHPAFNDFPVNNISYEEAEAYCEWLRNMLSKNFEVDKEKILVSLPSRSQWIYAAKGGHDENVYGWNGPYLRNAEGKFLANFKKEISQELISYDAKSKTYVVKSELAKTSHLRFSACTSFLPNDFGLYNMSGNVSEFTKENDQVYIMGGSYDSPGYDIRIDKGVKSKEANLLTGFRPVVQIRD